jgi:hypothetical protein
VCEFELVPLAAMRACDKEAAIADRQFTRYGREKIC